MAAVSMSAAPRGSRAGARSAAGASSAPARRRRAPGPLKGVVALVDVRVGADAQIDCSDVVARKLKELGASTVKRLTPKLTHLVLSHFSPAWKQKAAKWQAGGGSMAAAAARYELKIVSQLWVNACYVSKQRMDERPFFPVSQAEPVNVKRRQSTGASEIGASQEEPPRTPPPSKLTKAGNAARRKRRALSMEPMTSDAILKMLATEPSTPQQPTKPKSVSSSAKRRRTISCPPKTEDVEDMVSASQATNASSIVAESESEDEKEDKNRKEVIEIPDSQPSPAMKKASPVMSTRSSDAKENTGEFSVGTTDSSKKEPTARELRRRNRNSLTYGSGLTLKTGIWSCTACGCSNPRGRRFCTACQAPKGSAKSPTASASVVASSPTASTVTESPATPVEATLATTTPSQSTTTASKSASPTPVVTTPKRKTRSSTSATKTKTPSPAVKERTPRSLTRATASSAAKTRTPSPAVSRITRSSASRTPSPAVTRATRSPAIRVTTPSPAKRVKTPSPAPKASPPLSQSKRPRTTPSLGSASALPPAPSKTPTAKKTSRKPPTASKSNAMKPTQSAAKRARPASGNTITTPVVKKARREMNKENTLEEKHMATPGSVSLFPRKHRDVNSTPIQPIPMAMSFSSTTSRKTPRKTRNIIGITGVNSEKRGVLECAIHAIDANMCNESGHRKARVVKSVDYSAGVTHLIVGKETRRTMKVLFAIARGAWIVTEDWAFSSLDQERWLPEEDFELTMFANKFSRLHPDSRQIFKGMKFFVGSNVEPSREVLQSLIQVAGGEICKQISVADICICGDASLFRRAQRAKIRVVTSKWIFDSIATMKLEDDAKYTFDGSDSSAHEMKSSQASASGLEAHSIVPE